LVRQLVAEQIQGMRSELDQLLQARHLPSFATYNQRLKELTMALPPDQRHNQIHVLNHLAAQLETAINLVASVDTTGLVRHAFAESMLREVVNLLDHTLEVVREQAAAIQESDPQTSGPL
jgi:hypothetical protein